LSMLLLYRILFMVALVLASPYLLIKALFGKHGITERFGFIKNRASSKRLIWFHAASVGELKVISSIMPEIAKIDGDMEFAVSTTTATGRRRALELFGEKAVVLLQPLELVQAVRRVIRRLRPEKLLVVETEIWPLMVTVAANSGVEVNLVNGRMSRSSFKLYRVVKPLTSRSLKAFSRVLVQSEADADRFRSLGAERCDVMGNLKYDQTLDNGGSGQSLSNIKKGIKLLLVAGSIRKGEYEIFAELITKSRKKNLDVAFVLVPRHMKDIEYVRQLLSNGGISYRLWSETPGKGVDLESVLVVDAMGLLRDFYRLADLAFVGGSLVPIGGHDPLEPAALGKPVIFGPHMENAREAADLLLNLGGAVEISSTNQLFEILENSIRDRQTLKEKGKLCRKAVLSKSGASKRTAQIILGDRE
jgi:3-deoxy-D-manno-octulosonic-acid transferase